jgi:hypothetical protein
VLRVDDAVTDARWIWLSLLVIVAVYASMTVIGARIIRSMSRRWRDGGAEVRTPYGPETPADG